MFHLASVALGVGQDWKMVNHIGDHFLTKGAGITYEMHPARVELFVVDENSKRLKRIWPMLDSGGILLDEETLFFTGFRESGTVYAFVATKEGLVADITDTFVSRPNPRGAFGQVKDSGNLIAADVYNADGSAKFVSRAKRDLIIAGRKKISRGKKHREFKVFEIYE
jgi:hypothetical protein